MRGPFQAVFLVLVLAALVQVFWQHDRLPERVAAHFDAAGRANGWMSRHAHTAWHIGTLLFITALFQGIALLQSRLPKDYVNIPHRAHWLAPERAAATHAWIAGAVLLLGCTVMIFFIALFHLLYRANLANPPLLGSAVWWLTGGLLATVAGVIATLVARFGRKPAG